MSEGDSSLPKFFTDKQIAICTQDDALLPRSVLESIGPVEDRVQATYPLTWGLMVRLRTANARCEKTTRIYVPKDEKGQIMLSWNQTLNSLSVENRQFLTSNWTPESLNHDLTEISQKRCNISLELGNKLDHMPALPRDPENGLLQFDLAFLTELASYLTSVARPGAGANNAETFEKEIKDSLLVDLSAMKREKCIGCNGNRYMYCGTCGGVRMPEADAILPPRINLEDFDVLVLLHWQEHADRCTSMQAAASAHVGQVSECRYSDLITSIQFN